MTDTAAEYAERKSSIERLGKTNIVISPSHSKSAASADVPGNTFL